MSKVKSNLKKKLDGFVKEGKEISKMYLGLKEFSIIYNKLVKLELEKNIEFCEYLGEKSGSMLIDTLLYIFDNYKIDNIVYWEIKNWYLNLKFNNGFLISVPLFNGNENWS